MGFNGMPTNKWKYYAKKSCPQCRGKGYFIEYFIDGLWVDSHECDDSFFYMPDEELPPSGAAACYVCTLPKMESATFEYFERNIPF